MKKLISLLFIVTIVVSFVFADEITNLLDKAKEQYNNNETESLIKTIDSIKEKITKKEVNTNSVDIVEVGFNRLKVSPEKYVGNSLKIKGTAISSSGFHKLDYYKKSDEYGVSLTNVAQNDYFPAYLNEGKLIFVMDDSFVDKLLDLIPVGYSAYYNIWTEPVYEYTYYLSQYSPARKCYIAKIIKLEPIEYNNYTGQTFDTGEYIEK